MNENTRSESENDLLSKEQYNLLVEKVRAGSEAAGQDFINAMDNALRGINDDKTMHIIKRREQRIRDMFLAEWFIGGFIVGVLIGLWLWA